MTATTDLLIADHDKIETLSHSFSQADHPRLRQELFNETKLELAKHTTAEEQVVYPAVRQHVPDGDAIVDHAEDEHAEAKRMIQELVALTANDPTFATRYAQLIAAVMHHAAEEENNMFHLIDRHFPEDSHTEIVRQIEEAKKSVIVP